MQQQLTLEKDMMKMDYLIRLLIVRNDPLSPNNSSAKVGVNCQGDHLIVFSMSLPCKHNLMTMRVIF